MLAWKNRCLLPASYNLPQLTVANVNFSKVVVEKDKGNGLSGTIISEDPALRGPITETVREEVIPRGILAFQNRRLNVQHLGGGTRLAVERPALSLTRH